MNLLNDKREQERPVEEPIFEQDQTGEIQQDVDPIPVSPQQVKPKTKKNSFGPLLVIILIIILAVVIVYFGFYKNKTGVTTSDSKTPASAEISQDDSEQDSTVGQEASTEPAASSVVVSGQNGPTSLKIASDIMQNIQTGLAGGRVSALFIDEGSFSAEIDAGSASRAKQIYDEIKQALPPGIKLTSPAPQAVSNVFIAGTFASQSFSGASNLSSAEIESTLREIVRVSNSTVSSLNINSQAEQKFVFIKVDGSFPNCRLFIEKLSQELVNINVSKLIIMPGQGDNYTFVLRFYL